MISKPTMKYQKLRLIKFGGEAGRKENGFGIIAGHKKKKGTVKEVARLDQKLRDLQHRLRAGEETGARVRRKYKYSKLFRVEPGSKLNLRKINPEFTAGHKKKKAALKELEQLDQRLRALQFRLYAEGQQSLLICLQALDAAGKDGTIIHVSGAMNPQGTRVHSFKVPTREETAHDFLWRIGQRVPARGEVVIFNRSHYEDVLVVRVRGIVPKKVWKQRYQMINEFEKKLVANGTHVLKFFLHISPEEQLRRFKKRLDDPARHWKISESDYTEREFWDDYIEAYKEAVIRTSTKHAPWHVIPSNNKWFRNLAVTRIVVETLEAMNMKFPKPTVNIKNIRRKYHQVVAVDEKKKGRQPVAGETENGDGRQPVKAGKPQDAMVGAIALTEAIPANGEETILSQPLPPTASMPQRIANTA